MLVRVKHIITNEVREKDLPITIEQLQAFQAGGYVQDVFPHLNSDDREFLLTGMTKQEWDSMWNECEDKGHENPELPPNPREDLSFGATLHFLK